MTDRCCTYPDCSRPLAAYGLCITHRRMQLRGDPLRPIAGPRQVNKGKICAFDGCERPAYCVGLCRGHDTQRKRGRELHAIGDTDRIRAIRKAHWASLTEEERKARLAPMHAPRRRSEAHARAISESLKARWRVGYKIDERQCRGCGCAFQPNSGSHWWCEPACRARLRRLRRHGLEFADYAAMLERQRWGCAICGRSERGWGGKEAALVIDHCHATGRVRGLLCGECNTALGRFGDDPAQLRRAADYLDQSTP